MLYILSVSELYRCGHYELSLYEKELLLLEKQHRVHFCMKYASDAVWTDCGWAVAIWEWEDIVEVKRSLLELFVAAVVSQTQVSEDTQMTEGQLSEVHAVHWPWGYFVHA